MGNFELTTKTILEDERVLLRPLKRSDFDHLLSFSLTEPEIWKYSALQPDGQKGPAGAAGLEQYIDAAVAARDAKKEFPFIVFDKQADAYVGSTRFYDIQLHNKVLQLGYTWYGKAYQGTGLNKRCKYLLLAFAFETMEMERVEFRADATNQRSIAAMKSIGCTVEGVLRSNALRADGTRRDSIILSILREEWFQKVQEELKKKL